MDDFRWNVVIVSALIAIALIGFVIIALELLRTGSHELSAAYLILITVVLGVLPAFVAAMIYYLRLSLKTTMDAFQKQTTAAVPPSRRRITSIMNTVDELIVLTSTQTLSDIKIQGDLASRFSSIISRICVIEQNKEGAYVIYESILKDFKEKLSISNAGADTIRLSNATLHDLVSDSDFKHRLKAFSTVNSEATVGAVQKKMRQEGNGIALILSEKRKFIGWITDPGLSCVTKQ